MSTGTFLLEIVTPLKVTSREVRSLRLKDGSGFFGVMKGHLDMVAVLVPALGRYLGSDDKERFLAVDGGIFSMRQGIATITSREVFESDDADGLAQLMEKTFASRDSSEVAVARMIEGLERSFLEKNAALARGRR